MANADRDSAVSVRSAHTPSRDIAERWPSRAKALGEADRGASGEQEGGGDREDEIRGNHCVHDHPCGSEAMLTKATRTNAERDPQ